jgi:cytochrome c oxidase assembly protein subunit 15
MRVPELTPRAFRRLTLCNLVLLAIIIVTGAAVRLTDSGLGCDDWPNCNADNFVSVGSKHEAIEQLNRLFSGLIVVPIVLILIASYRRRPRRHDFVALSWVMLVLYLGNAVLGGVSVLVKLAWVSVMGHFLLAIALVAVALIIHKRAAEPDGPRAYVVSTRVRVLARVVYALTVWVLVLGTLVTAAGPHGGDIEAKRLSWQITDLARTHAISVDILVGLVVVLVVLVIRDRAPRRVLSSVSVVLASMVAQGILGYVQYAQGIPELLVGFHVAGAVLVFGSVQWLQLELREPVAASDRRAAPGPEPGAAAAANPPQPEAARPCAADATMYA